MDVCNGEVSENEEHNACCAFGYFPIIPEYKDGKINFTINCSFDREQDAIYFLKHLARMEYDGHIGHTETLKFEADGDGTFRPDFEIGSTYKLNEFIKKLGSSYTFEEFEKDAYPHKS